MLLLMKFVPKVVFVIIFQVPPTNYILNDKGDLNQEPSKAPRMI